MFKKVVYDFLAALTRPIDRKNFMLIYAIKAKKTIRFALTHTTCLDANRQRIERT